MLWLLKQLPKRPSDFLGEIVGTKSNISQRLNALEESGLIERNPAPLDRREIMVTITPEGKKLLKKSKIELSRFELSAMMNLYSKLDEAIKRL